MFNYHVLYFWFASNYFSFFDCLLKSEIVVFPCRRSKGNLYSFDNISHPHLCLKSQVLGKEAFQKQMLEKLIWISSVMLVGARHGRVSVGVVEREFRSEVSFANWLFLKVNLLILLINVCLVGRQYYCLYMHRLILYC